MRTLLMIAVLVLLTVGLAGCGEEFAGGFASGAAAMGVMAEDAQNKFVMAVNELNAETNRINETMAEIDGTLLVRPDTLAALKSLKERKDDPVTWVALASMLAGGFFGGQSFAKRRTM